MTDEEKAEEILQTKGSMTFCAKGCGYTEKVKELIAIGLAEGRKEVREHETTCVIRLRHIEKENEIMKTILLDVFKKHGDLCSLCEVKGQKLPECKCMKDNECLEHIIELYGAK